jgi:RNA polymerase sigma-70 factor (ECF subfamily)
LNEASGQIEKLIVEGARRLLSRAEDCYSLEVETVIPRVRASLEKYLLRYEPNASQEAIGAFIDQLQASDLCLALACECINQNAWSDLVERYSPTVRSAARSAAGSEDAAEDLAQSIWAELYGLRVRDDGRRASKLAYYSGRGSLAGWLRAVVAQLAVDQHRKQSRLVQTGEDADFDRLPRLVLNGRQAPTISSGLLNPERALANKLERVEMEKALARSIKEMADEDRLLVKLYYFDNLVLREAAAVLGVHEATASRRLARIHVELRKSVENILIAERGWTKAETEMSFSELALDLEPDVESLLVHEGIGEKQTGRQNEIGTV